MKKKKSAVGKWAAKHGPPKLTDKMVGKMLKGNYTLNFGGESVSGTCSFTIAASAATCERAHPIDEFDTLTAAGYKLNLVTGEYERKDL